MSPLNKIVKKREEGGKSETKKGEEKKRGC